MPIGNINNFDQSLVDAFGRLRISSIKTIFESKLLYDNQPLLWDDQEVSGSGTSSTYTQVQAKVALGVSNLTAGKRVRQTFQRFNYQPGKSHLIFMTTRFSSIDTGIVNKVGLFDDNNGLFFMVDNGVIKVVRRTSTSGSPVDNEVTQANWNLDRLDGTDSSGYNIDFTKVQLLIIDFAWLGVGRIRMGVDIDGRIIYCHEFLVSNILETVHMSTPNLPLRYEISNDGTGSSATLDAICNVVIAEGGAEGKGITRYISNGVTFINANTANTIYALVGLRLKSTALSALIDIIDISITSGSSDTFEWLLLWNPTVGTTLSWNNESNSVIQSAVGDSGNPSLSTLTGGYKIAGGYISSGKSTGGGGLKIIDPALHLGSKIDGTRDEIYLAIKPFSSNSDVAGSITWRELQ